MELGERLYQLRRERRMSQEALADALGVSRQSVSKWENGASTPDLDKLVRLGELFGLSLDELVKGQAPPTAEGTEAAVRPPCSKGRMIAAVVLLVCGGLAALLLFATTLLYFAVWLLLAGVLCLRARERLGILLGGTAWLFALLFFETGTVLSPWDIFSPAAYRFYPPFYLLLDWLAFLPFLLLLGLAVRAAWGRFDRSSLMRLGLAAALFFAARVVCGLLNHSLLASSLLELDFGFYFPWPYQLSKTALLLALFPLPFGGYRRRPFVVLAGWVLSFGLDRLAAAAFPYSTFLYYYWPLLLLLFYLALAWAGAAWERRRPPQA